MNDVVLTRRKALASIGTMFVPLAAARQEPAQESELRQLNYRRYTRADHERINDWDTDEFIIDIEKNLRCMCGCDQDVYQCRTTDFTCPLWPQTHARIIDMVKDEMTGKEIVDVFISEHGEEVLMAPVAAGFNLTAYFLPGLLISSVAGMLVWVFARRSQVNPATADVMQGDGISSEEDERIRREMEKLEL